MVADRHRLAAYHNKHCWRAFHGYQHRWPWRTLNAQNRGFSEFFAILGVRRTLSEWMFAEIAVNRRRQPAYEIILMLWRASSALAQISCCRVPQCRGFRGAVWIRLRWHSAVVLEIDLLTHFFEADDIIMCTWQRRHFPYQPTIIHSNFSKYTFRALIQ